MKRVKKIPFKTAKFEETSPPKEEEDPLKLDSRSSLDLLTEKKAIIAASAVVSQPSWQTNKQLSSGASKLANLRKNTFQILYAESTVKSECKEKQHRVNVSDVTKQILRNKQGGVQKATKVNGNTLGTNNNNKSMYMYKCAICSLRYQDLQTLKSHMEQHPKEEWKEVAESGTNGATATSSVGKSMVIKEEPLQIITSTSKIKPSTPTSSALSRNLAIKTVVKNEVLRSTAATSSPRGSKLLTDEDHLKILKQIRTAKDLGKTKSIIIQMYKNMKIYICSLCLEIFTDHPTSLQHLLTHNNDGETSNSKSDLHTGKKIANEVDMSIYEDDDFDDEDSGGKSTGAKFGCNVCDKKFNCMLTLTTHLKLHMNQRNLKSSQEANFPKKSVTGSKKNEGSRSAGGGVTAKSYFNERQALDRRKNQPVKEEEQEEIEEVELDTSGRLYCICNDISYGKMVGCDNEDCPIEWFHFPCMKLTKEPVGDWYCPHCIKYNKVPARKKSKLSYS